MSITPISSNLYHSRNIERTFCFLFLALVSSEKMYKKWVTVEKVTGKIFSCTFYIILSYDTTMPVHLELISSGHWG
jgi:hypothetical protein